MQQCRYSAAALLCESWREHFRTTFLAPAKARWFETSFSRREKARKISDLPVPSGCAAWNLGCARDSVARPGHQLGDLWLFPEGRKDAPLSNKRVAPWAPTSTLGETWGALPSWALCPWPSRAGSPNPLSSRFPSNLPLLPPFLPPVLYRPQTPQFSGGQLTWVKEHKENPGRVFH